MRTLNTIRMGGIDVLPLVEGGKGICVSNGATCGHWAAAGGVGTLSAANADGIDDHGMPVRQVFYGATRRERHEEIVALAIAGGIAQVRHAHDIAGGRGRLHVNILWELGGAERVLEAVLKGAAGLIHGVTCGAGMPYRLAAVARRHSVYYYPIVSSARAFGALWKRAYCREPELLGGVVYEDPWLAGGHNGLSNGEDPTIPEDPFPRVLALRTLMRGYGLDRTPIVVAGGVWWLDEWEGWIENPDLGPIAFQFGTRLLLTRESPIGAAWKRALLNLRPGGITTNRFSPTGFYSSSVSNGFSRELDERNARQVAFLAEACDGHVAELAVGVRGRTVFLTREARRLVAGWEADGFTEGLRTPSGTLVFVTPSKAAEIHQDQVSCMGCLSNCRFSNWSQAGEHRTTGIKPDPRSYCIQKTLQAIAHTDDFVETENNLMFSGYNGYRFGSDPYYRGDFVPSVRELFGRILTGR